MIPFNKVKSKLRYKFELLEDPDGDEHLEISVRRSIPETTRCIAKVCLLILLLSLLLTLACFSVADHLSLREMENSLTRLKAEMSQEEKTLENELNLVRGNVTGTLKQAKTGVTKEISDGGEDAYVLKRLQSVESELRAVRTSEALAGISRSCGGFLNISGSHQIIYELPFPQYVQTCAWVLWSNNQSSLEVAHANDSNLDFLPTFTVVLADNPGWLEVNYVRLLPSEEPLEGHSPLIIFFHGIPTRPRQGIHLLVTEIPTTVSDEPNGSSASRIQPNQPVSVRPDVFSVTGSFSSKFPIPSLNPAPAQLRPTVIIGHAVPGMRINVLITNFQTRKRFEWLSLFWFDVVTGDFRTMFNLTGYYNSSRHMNVNLKESEPFVLYLTENTFRGMRISRFNLNVTYEAA